MIVRCRASDPSAGYEIPATDTPMKTLIAICFIVTGFAGLGTVSANAETTQTTTTTTTDHAHHHHMRHHHHHVHHEG